jgi:hypothetical protein
VYPGTYPPILHLQNKDTLKMESEYSYETLLRICQITRHHPQNTVILIFTAVGYSQHGKSSPTFRRHVLAPSSELKRKLSKCFLLASYRMLAFLFGLVYGGSVPPKRLTSQDSKLHSHRCGNLKTSYGVTAPMYV